MVGFHPDAADELIETAAWYESAVPALGECFVAAVETAIHLLAGHRELGQEIESGFRHFVLAEFPHSVIYRLEPECVWVVAIAHHKRAPGYWRERPWR